MRASDVVACCAADAEGVADDDVDDDDADEDGAGTPSSGSGSSIAKYAAIASSTPAPASRSERRSDHAVGARGGVDAASLGRAARWWAMTSRRTSTPSGCQRRGLVRRSPHLRGFRGGRGVLHTPHPADAGAHTGGETPRDDLGACSNAQARILTQGFFLFNLGGDLLISRLFRSDLRYAAGARPTDHAGAGSRTRSARTSCPRPTPPFRS